MKMKKINLIIVFLVLGFSGFAQTSLSLMDAIQKALENNYDIRIQKMDENIAGLNNNWGTAGRYPTVSLSGNSNNKSDFNDADNYTNLQLSGGVTLNWTLFDGFRVNITKQRLAELENMTKGYTAVLVEGTLQSVIATYYNVLLEQEILQVYKENAQLSKDRADYQQMRKDIGNAVSYEVLQASNSYLADKASVLLQEANVKSAMRELVYLMGEETGSYELNGKLETQIQDYKLDDLVQAMLLNNKNLKNQYINQTLAEKATALAKANYYPKLSLSAGAQAVSVTQNYVTSNDFSSTSSNVFGNLSLTYNLFNGGVRKRAVQIAKIEEEMSSIEIDAMKVSLTNQLSNLFDFYDARKEMYSLAEERLKVAQINLEISNQKFKAGTINSFNFRDVQLSYQEAAIARLNAIYNLIDVNTSLLRITGGIIEESTTK